LKRLSNLIKKYFTKLIRPATTIETFKQRGKKKCFYKIAKAKICLKRLSNPVKRLKYRIETFKQIFFDKFLAFCFAYPLSLNERIILPAYLNKELGNK